MEVCTGSRKGGCDGSPGSGLAAAQALRPSRLQGTWERVRLGTQSHESVGPGPRTGAEASVAEYFRVELHSSGESRKRETCADLSCLPASDLLWMPPLPNPVEARGQGAWWVQPVAFTLGHRAGWRTVEAESGKVKGAHPVQEPEPF